MAERQTPPSTVHCSLFVLALLDIFRQPRGDATPCLLRSRQQSLGRCPRRGRRFPPHRNPTHGRAARLREQGATAPPLPLRPLHLRGRARTCADLPFRASRRASIAALHFLHFVPFGRSKAGLIRAARAQSPQPSTSSTSSHSGRNRSSHGERDATFSALHFFHFVPRSGAPAADHRPPRSRGNRAHGRDAPVAAIIQQ